MTDGKVAAASGQETSPLRCREIIQTDRGSERGYPHRSLAPIPVRYASADSAT